MDKDRIKSIDGLRMLANFIVIAGHTWAFGLQGVEGIGTMTFFILSGFLITDLKYEHKEEKYIGIRNILIFFIKRSTRILPLYWIIVLFYHWLSPNEVIIKDNLLFIKPYLILWFMQHLVIFYAMTPVVFVGIYLLKHKLKFNNIWIAATFFLLSYIYIKTDLGGFMMLKNTIGVTPLRLDTFLFGLGLGYLCKSVSIKKFFEKAKKMDIIMDIIQCLIIGCIVIRPLFNYIYQYQTFTKILILLFVFCTYFNQNGIMKKILSLKPLIYIGKLDYGMYLLHWFVFISLYSSGYSLTHGNHGNQIFIITYLLTLCISNTLHLWVEEPISRLSTRLVDKVSILGKMK